MATTLKGTQINLATMISPASGNLLQAKSDGLYAALAAPDNVQIQYVSSSTGNDSNPGTRAQPLKTLMRAIDRIPDNTAGNRIFLLEGDVFPVRASTDPQVWGTTINYFGSVIATSNKSIYIDPYGPQMDSYAGLEVNAVNFSPLLIPTLNRPILEFGHWMYNGSPVGCSIVMGNGGGGHIELRGCAVRFTPECIAAVQSTGIPWSGGAYTAPIIAPNTNFMGVVFPAPLTNSSGALMNVVLTINGDLVLWNTSVPNGTVAWGNVGAPSKITFLDSGTMTDNTGHQYPTVPNTTASTASTRLTNIVRDSNGTPRNITSNVVI